MKVSDCVRYPECAWGAGLEVWGGWLGIIFKPI
jgi:hypothetical protein